MNFKKNTDEKIFNNKIFSLIKSVLNVTIKDGNDVKPAY
jgi:hypothetical protein